MGNFGLVNGNYNVVSAKLTGGIYLSVPPHSEAVLSGKLTDHNQEANTESGEPASSP